MLLNEHCTHIREFKHHFLLFFLDVLGHLFQGVTELGDESVSALSVAD